MNIYQEERERDVLEHDHDTPGDSPLLCADETTTLGGWSQFGDVDGDLSRTDTDRETVDDAPDDEHSDVLGSASDGRTDAPGVVREIPK